MVVLSVDFTIPPITRFCSCQLVIAFITPASQEKDAEGCSIPSPPQLDCDEDPNAEGCTPSPEQEEDEEEAKEAAEDEDEEEDTGDGDEGDGDDGGDDGSAGEEE